MKDYPDWLNIKGEDILKEIKKIRDSDNNGMDKFKQERSKILELTYICMENTNSDFGVCQKEAWKVKKGEE